MNKKAFGEYKYTVYKVTNKLNGHIYIGVHKTKDVNDLYYGSGSVICKAIKKYGKENFSKEILFIFNTQKDAYKKENEIVDEDFIKRADTYNTHIGGKGGWDFVNKDSNQRKIRSEKFDEYLEKKVRKNREKREKLKFEYECNPLYCELCGKKIPFDTRKRKYCSRKCSCKVASKSKRRFSEETKKQLKEQMFKNFHSEEAERKRSITRKKIDERKRKEREEKYYLEPKKCEVCQKVISFDKKKRRTCSRECHKKLQGVRLKKNVVI